MLLSTARVRGLAKALSDGLAPWRLARSVHEPAKTMRDLAVAIALGGDCLAHIAVVRSQPDVFGPVASDPTLSRLIEAWLKNRLRRSQRSVPLCAHARNRVWSHRTPFGDDADDRQVIVDLDATLIGARSGKDTRPELQGGFGFHPMLTFRS